MYNLKSIFHNFFHRLINLKFIIELQKNKSLELFNKNIKFPKNDAIENLVKRNLIYMIFLFFIIITQIRINLKMS